MSIADDKLAAGPLVAKVYDASLIKVTDVGSAVVGQQCQFKGKKSCFKIAPSVFICSLEISSIHYGLRADPLTWSARRAKGRT